MWSLTQRGIVNVTDQMRSGLELDRILVSASVDFIFAHLSVKLPICL